MSQDRHALHITATHHTLDGVTRANPVPLWDAALPAVIAQMMRIVCGYGVVLIERSAAVLLGLPSGGPLPVREAAKGHPFATALREAGFACRDVGRWFHVKHAQHGDVRFALTEYLDADHFPLLDAPGPVTQALAWWHELAGIPWDGGAGDAGNAILRTMRYLGPDRKERKPEWWSWAGPTLEGGAAPIEYPFLPTSWRRPVPGAERACGIDRVRAYLSAMTCTEVAGEALTHDGLTVFDRKRCGWWLVALGPWHFHHLMPDPAGYGRGVTEDQPRTRWLSTPRVQLLSELHADDLYDFRILDSWTAPGTDVVKKYGTRLREMWTATAGIDSPLVRELVRAGIKGAYQLGHGYMRSKQSQVQRPDYAAAITATSAANLWRRGWTLGIGEGGFGGPWPMWIDTDNVFYPHDYPHADGLTVWDGTRPDLDDVTQLGHWRTSETYPLDPATGWLVPRETTKKEVTA